MVAATAICQAGNFVPLPSGPSAVRHFGYIAGNDPRCPGPIRDQYSVCGCANSFDMCRVMEPTQAR